MFSPPAGDARGARGARGAESAESAESARGAVDTDGAGRAADGAPGAEFGAADAPFDDPSTPIRRVVTPPPTPPVGPHFARNIPTPNRNTMTTKGHGLAATAAPETRFLTPKWAWNTMTTIPRPDLAPLCGAHRTTGRTRRPAGLEAR